MRIKELVKKYDGKAVVDSVSFEIPKGKVISLIGPNGAGKSTVMGMISRLIAKYAGLIVFEEKDFDTIMKQEVLFVRKVRAGVSDSLMDKIDCAIQEEELYIRQ